MSYVTVSVHIDDILQDMTRAELQKLVDNLYDDGYRPKKFKITPNDNQSSDSTNFDLQVQKLIGNSWRLSKEDEETVLRIANKIITK